MDYLAQNRNPFSASPLNLQKTKEIEGKEAHLSSSRVCTQQWRPPPPGKTCRSSTLPENGRKSTIIDWPNEKKTKRGGKHEETNIEMKA